MKADEVGGQAGGWLTAAGRREHDPAGWLLDPYGRGSVSCGSVGGDITNGKSHRPSKRQALTCAPKDRADHPTKLEAKIVAFHPDHIGMMTPQPGQVAEVSDYSAAAEYGQAWTLMLDGPIACAGLVPMWNGRAYAWALLSDRAGKHMLTLTREIRSRLSSAGFARVEMAVDAGFYAGRRWAEMLGFECETPQPMKAYLPNGRPAYLYART